MPLFTVLVRLEPQAVFGLPDGNKVVVPVSQTPRELVGPALDTRTGKVVSHGTLSEYRKEGESASCSFSFSGVSASLRDNFLRIQLTAETAQLAAETAVAKVELWLQAMSVQFNQRFSSDVLSVDDEAGAPQPVRITPRQIEMLTVTVYDTRELENRARRSADWADAADAGVSKSLLYFEHACLLNEFAQTLPMFGAHAAFSRSLAFLQLFKALTTIIGDPSSDKDYQSRSKRIGLPADFWGERAKPLYRKRSISSVLEEGWVS